MITYSLKLIFLPFIKVAFVQTIKVFSKKKKYYRREQKNQTEKEDFNRFYGPAKSCEELSKIGYTRNGFYLVKGVNATSDKQVEMVDCLFTNPDGVKEGKKKQL